MALEQWDQQPDEPDMPDELRQVLKGQLQPLKDIADVLDRMQGLCSQNGLYVAQRDIQLVHQRVVDSYEGLEEVIDD